MTHHCHVFTILATIALAACDTGGLLVVTQIDGGGGGGAAPDGGTGGAPAMACGSKHGFGGCGTGGSGGVSVVLDGGGK